MTDGESGPPVVGPFIQGNNQEYQFLRQLQSALFGGVYEAKGSSTDGEFAIKVLHKMELAKAEESMSLEFCEVPLSEVRFAEPMKGHENVMVPQEHFEDEHCHYIVFDLCRGGDMLEALKQKPRGFCESDAQFLIKQATQGLAFLHKRRVAMQDVSLENMLLHVDESTGDFRVKICDPGQAALFEVDAFGQEMQVGYRGLIGKSFRPPELLNQAPYYATKIDSWCLGWSTFYLLTAQPLFMSAAPAQRDSDWPLFQKGELKKLMVRKGVHLSAPAFDFIQQLMHLDPAKRMTIDEALSHPWLADPAIVPVPAPKELWPDSLIGTMSLDYSPPIGAKSESPIVDEKLKLELESPPVASQLSPKLTLQPTTTLTVQQQQQSPYMTHQTSPFTTPAGTADAGAGCGIGSPKLGTVGSDGPMQRNSAEVIHPWTASAGMTAGQGIFSPVQRPALRVQSPPSRSPPQQNPGVWQFDHRAMRGRQMQVQGPGGRPYVVANAHSPAPAAPIMINSTRIVHTGVKGRDSLAAETHIKRDHVPVEVQAQQKQRPTALKINSPVNSSYLSSGSTLVPQQQPQMRSTPRMASRPRSPTGHELDSSIRTVQSGSGHLTAQQGQLPAAHQPQTIWAFPKDQSGNKDKPESQMPRTVRVSSPGMPLSPEIKHHPVQFRALSPGYCLAPDGHSMRAVPQSAVSPAGSGGVPVSSFSPQDGSLAHGQVRALSPAASGGYPPQQTVRLGGNSKYRYVGSPTRAPPVYVQPRSPSPPAVPTVGMWMPQNKGNPNIRAASPTITTRPGAFSWTQMRSAAAHSPSPTSSHTAVTTAAGQVVIGGNSTNRAMSPGNAVQKVAAPYVWNSRPVSPRAPRTISPAPPSALPCFPMRTAARHPILVRR